MTLRPIARYLVGVALWVFYHTGGRADPVESGEVRETPSWPGSWANFSLLQLYM
jgi:hypothetical protein